jgi:hypothetical protein
MTDQTTFTANPMIVSKVRKIGRQLTYNPKASVNDCLIALAGDWERLKQLEVIRLTPEGEVVANQIQPSPVKAKGKA